MLKVSQVAKRLNLSGSKVYELIEQGKLFHHRMGGAIRVSEEQLQRFLEETKRERSPSENRQPRARVRTFKHLDGDRLLAAWQQKDGRASPQDEDNAPSSESSYVPSRSKGS